MLKSHKICWFFKELKEERRVKVPNKDFQKVFQFQKLDVIENIKINQFFETKMKTDMYKKSSVNIFNKFGPFG